MSKTIDKLHQLVDEAILSNQKQTRTYLGASSLGTECDRQLWYSYHKPKTIDNAELLRKFRVGHELEPVIVSWLKDAGLTIWTGDDSGQFGFEDGPIAGHCDLVIRGIPGDEETPYLGEIKTANNFSFKDFEKHGIECNEKYKGQVQVYMHKFRLKKCLFIVLNKDTQKLYFEIVDYDEFEAIRLINRGKQIVASEVEPDRKYPNKAFFRCKFCNWSKECWP